MTGIFKIRVCGRKPLYMLSIVLGITFLYYLHTCYHHTSFYSAGNIIMSNSLNSEGRQMLKLSDNIDLEANSVVGVDSDRETLVSGTDNLVEDITDPVSIEKHVIQSIRNTDFTNTTSYHVRKQDSSMVQPHSNELEILPDKLTGNTEKVAWTISNQESSGSRILKYGDVTDSLNSSKEEEYSNITGAGNHTPTMQQTHKVDTATPLIPCNKLKSIPGIESNENWQNFRESLRKYSEFHREQIDKLQRAGEDWENVTTLTYACDNPSDCSGIGDQFYRIQQVLLLAVAFDRVLILHWDSVSMETFRHLLPNSIHWNYFNETSGMHLKPNPEIRKLKTNEHFRTLMQLLQDKTQTHLTISYAMPVPFGKGLTRLLRADKNGAFGKLLLNAMLNGKKNAIPLSVISGELLRFLFTFSQEVLLKVKEAQEKIGIQNVPFLSVHIRTGFWGTEFQEVGHFSPKKIFQTDDMWQMTMDCSTRLANTMLAPKAPVYLATDSYLVKMEAANDYSPQIRSLNMTLQHVALINKSRSRKTGTLDSVGLYPESNQTRGITTLTGVDGNMATWLDFILLARANILVHSISGFSTVAGQFCSANRQFYIPKCSQHP